MSLDIVHEDDPNRCQTVTSQGQCWYKAVEDGQNCMRHGGNKQLQSQEAQSLRNYRLTKHHARLSRLVAMPDIKSLRDEIAILRMLMEEKLESCSDTHDLIMMSGPISDLVLKIDKVVTSCHKLEGSMGQHLDKASILQFASEVITIIGNALEGQEDKINQISDNILEVVSRVGNE